MRTENIAECRSRCAQPDGNKGVGGCTYCNNQTFNPDYCRTEKSITRQLEEGKQFFAHKYPEMKYLAYLSLYQYVWQLEDLKRKYEEALSAGRRVVGLVIGTRPDWRPTACWTIWRMNGIHSFSEYRHREYRRQDTLPHQPRAYFPCRRRCGGKNRFTRNPDRWACHLGLPGETHESIVALRRRTVPSAAHYLEDAPAATDKGTRMALEYRQHPEDFHPVRCGRISTSMGYIEHLRPDGCWSVSSPSLLRNCSLHPTGIQKL